MAVVAKNVTYCTVCKRDGVGVSQNWARWQSGQAPEWRVARHRKDGAYRSPQKAEICAGSGILVSPDVVFPRELASA